MRAILGLLISSVLNGCALYSMTHPDKYTPEQLEALNKLGLDIYHCFTIGGPPPAGTATVIMVPKGKPVAISFSGSCQVMKASTEDEILMKLDKPLR